MQVVTSTVQQARDISDACSKLGLKSTSLTSSDTPAERVEKIRDWDEGRGDVLATTYDCGIDSKFVKEVHVIDCRSACAAIQAEGRCRPVRVRVRVRRVFPGQFLMSKNPGTNSTYVDLAGMLISLPPFFKVPAS